MITPELVGYIRGEFAKGRTREEIHKELVSSGGWTEPDLNEAFRVVVPMQNFSKDTTTTSTRSYRKVLTFALCLLFVGVLWFFRTPIVNFAKSSLGGISIPFIGGDEGREESVDTNVETSYTVEESANMEEKDCGVNSTFNVRNKSSYENDPALACLGASALKCENAKIILNDELFPTMFQVIRTGNTCSFKLSYDSASLAKDATGRSFASQYITCPVDMVKGVDETNPKAPVFSAPDTGNLSKYGSQIYFYGALGVFMENNVDKSRIQSLGCSGSYIDSIVASYNQSRP